ncbi:MAG TPA: Tol-Pal system beta propeller repeat protein TolB [Terriglobia bacterium]|nr:Tol-Pal system beta propeller repeat protein TolB [Terriglobia bacterium]
MQWQRIAVPFFLALAIVVALSLTPRTALSQQDQIISGINLGAPKIKLAVPDFPPKSVDQQLVSLTQEFNQVLWNDLDNAGIFEMVSKSNYPLKIPEEPLDVDFNAWSAAPASAQMLVFGKTENINSNLVITGRVFDLGNQANPGVMAKRYVATLNEVSTREAAHRFADEIIKTLGGGLPGINESRIAFVRRGSRNNSEIWVMDYDGFNQHPITSYHSLSTTPRWSPDNSKLAFTSYASGNPEIYIFSFETNRRISFPAYKGLNTTPAWSPDGGKIAFCSSMGGNPDIYISNANGSNLQRLTFSTGVNVSPAWNPKTGNEIAFVSDRSGSAQIYIMSADGTNLRRMTTAAQGGDASAPSWSPNGLFMAFHWRVSETGTYDIYIMEIASGRIIQLTHDAGRNEHPTWSPDGRHLAFESTRSGTRQIWSMLANGLEPKQLTKDGENWNANWSN